jgi:hypothetical protein
MRPFISATHGKNDLLLRDNASGHQRNTEPYFTPYDFKSSKPLASGQVAILSSGRATAMPAKEKSRQTQERACLDTVKATLGIR